MSSWVRVMRGRQRPRYQGAFSEALSFYFPGSNLRCSHTAVRFLIWVFFPIIFLHLFETSPIPPPFFFPEWVRTCRPRHDGGGGSFKKNKKPRHHVTWLEFMPPFLIAINLARAKAGEGVVVVEEGSESRGQSSWPIESGR